ncbi:MAG: ATP-dependent protease ATPase subunit HslU [Hydrotalea sp.]|nr:ATP-dependent protease ATPase subunit HslU [Hydrotalea sp.]
MVTSSLASSLTPRQIVDALDKHIIGQAEAKKMVAIALRNRFRRSSLPKPLADEILPKNILMIGPTGCGKTEIARRLAKLVGAPFIKVEATRYTEVGYVGRDVESIIRDLLEVAIKNERQRREDATKPKASDKVNEKLLRALVGKDAKAETRAHYKEKLLSGELDDSEITIELAAAPKNTGTMMEIPGSNAGIGMIQISDAVEGMMGKMFKQKQEKTMSVKRAREELMAEAMEKLLDHDEIVKVAMEQVEQHGIVFIDEFDKICVRDSSARQDVSREGVQRDLLPMIEGTAVATRHGIIKTDYILFVASGAFHQSKPSDLLPELQGRLPIRVRLNPLSRADFINILTHTEHNLISQYQHLLKVDAVDVRFDAVAIDAIADFAMEINSSVENIGARRLHTLIEKLLEDISFEADGKEKITNSKDGDKEIYSITADMVKQRLAPLVEDQNLQKFIL